MLKEITKPIMYIDTIHRMSKLNGFYGEEAQRLILNYSNQKAFDLIQSFYYMRYENFAMLLPNIYDEVFSECQFHVRFHKKLSMMASGIANDNVRAIKNGSLKNEKK